MSVFHLNDKGHAVAVGTVAVAGSLDYRVRRLGWWAATLILVFLSGAIWSGAEDTAAGLFPETPMVSTGTTVITSQRLEFDNRERVAVFEGNVLVRDDTMQMRSDRLTVTFDETEQPARVVAQGNVVMLQANWLARSQSAVYDVVEGKMVLSGAAEVRRGRDLLKGDIITFWRDRDRIEVVPGTLIIAPETRRDNQSLMGP